MDTSPYRFPMYCNILSNCEIKLYLYVIVFGLGLDGPDGAVGRVDKADGTTE